MIYQPESDFPTALQATPKEDVYGIKVCGCILGEMNLKLFLKMAISYFRRI